MTTLFPHYGAVTPSVIGIIAYLFIFAMFYFIDIS